MIFFQRLFFRNHMTPKRFSRYLIIAEESKAYGKIAEKVYGINLGQFNLLPKAQLDRLTGLLYPGEDVLDVGCGNGKMTKAIAQAGKCRIKGIDFATDAISHANRKFSSSAVTFEVMNITELSRIKERFSKIIAIDSLYYFSDLKPILGTMIHLLRDQGMIILFYSYNIQSHYSISVDLIDKALTGSNIIVEKYDYTHEEITFWNALQRELTIQKDAFIKEGNVDFYKMRLKEANAFVNMGKKNGLKRIMYLITP